MPVTQTIEYAFLSNFTTIFNEPYLDGETTKYRHTISMVYLLQDPNRLEVNRIRRIHVIDGLDSMEDFEQINQRLYQSMPTWVTDDKANLSGYAV